MWITRLILRKGSTPRNRGARGAATLYQIHETCRVIRTSAVLLAICLLSGCINQNVSRNNVSSGDVGLLGEAGRFMTSGQPDVADARSGAGADRRPVVGFTELSETNASADERNHQIQASPGGGTYNINFVNVDLQEFVRAVFDEVLHENVVIDPNLKGKVTIRTSEPISKSTAQGLVRDALQTVGATLSRSGSAWRVTSISAAAARTLDMVRVLPLRYISARDARQALQSLGPDSRMSLTPATSGRFLIAAGGPSELETVEQLLMNLDIDELRGRSFALIPLKVAGAASVSRDLAKMLEGAQAVRAFPIDRMNAIMVVSENAAMVERAKQWIARLDQAGQDERRVYAYPLRNRRAAEVAQVLDGILRGRGQIETTREAVVPPSLTPQRTEVASASTLGGGSPTPIRQGLLSEELPASPQTGRSDLKMSGVDVRADTSTNALVIVANPDDYRIVEAAIRSLDVLPTQILIEAVIAEVRLNDTLRHGVRWYFEKGLHGIGLTGGASTSEPGGLTYSFGVPNAKIVLNALESVTNVEIVSSPALTVLNNQTATLKVGDQVPVATRSARSVTTPDAPLVNDIEMKDTGIILSVTPRVNASGLVMLDIKQQASDVVPTTSSTIDSPTIRQREITSTVAVDSGSEIVLGGIISRRQDRGKTGVPLLKDIPVLGAAFTSDGKIGSDRTELLVIIRPVIMANRAEVRAVTEEIKARMRGARGGVY